MKQLGLIVSASLVMCAASALPAAAQYSAPKMNSSQSSSSSGAVGEDYHIQFSGGLWNPDVSGVIASSQFGQVGTKIDFVKDLKFEKTKFSDLRLELRVTPRNKFYAQYIPLTFSSPTGTTLSREVVFNGQRFQANVPLQTTFEWKVWRVGYEVDVVKLSRGFVGLNFEARQTNFNASLKIPGTSEFTKASGPLPAVGMSARVYILPNLSISAMVTGFKVPDVSPDYSGNYLDIDVYGTFNFTRNFGVQGGYRKINTTVQIKDDFGDTVYNGIWFGGVVRY